MMATRQQQQQLQRQQQQQGREDGNILLVPWSSGPREIACRRCRIRKKRCDKKRPTCQECARAGAECQVLRPKKVNSSREAQSSYVHLLEDHIASLESKFRQAYPAIADDHLSPGLLRRTSTPSSSSFPTITPTPSHEYGRGGGNQLDSNQVVSRQVQGVVEVEEDDDHVVNEWVAAAMEPMDGVCLNQQGYGTGEAAAAGESPPPSISPSMLLLDLGTYNHHAPHQQQQPRSPSPPPVINHLNLSSNSLLSHRHVSLTAADMYVSEYFRNAHPMWPFLHPKQWTECWSVWQSRDHHPADDDQMAMSTFFVDMVLSIGALLTVNSDPDPSRCPEHLESFKYLKRKALAQYDQSLHATSTWPAIFRTQSSLLLTIQAMHSDSIDTLRSRASEAMMNCTLSKLHMDAQRRSRSQNNNNNSDLSSPRNEEVEEEMQRQVVRSCYIIDIIISYSTNQGVSFVDNIVEDELLDSDDTVRSDSSSPSSSHASSPIPTINATMAEDHIFRLRRIQYRILKMVQKLEHEAQRDKHPVPNLWRSQIRHDVSRWANDVAAYHYHYSGSSSHGGVGGLQEERFTSQAWLLKLANYTIISLFPNTHLAVRSGDARHLVSAACQVLVTFRRLRVKEHITCYTWTALMHQFQAGITILYCLWATPTHKQHILYDRRAVSQALFACSATLVDYANKWPSTARILRDIFELLVHDIPISEFGDPSQQWELNQESRIELRRLMSGNGNKLEVELQLSRKVVGLLVEMAGGAGGNGIRPLYYEERMLGVEETRWVQFVYMD